MTGRRCNTLDASTPCTVAPQLLQVTN
jgi:hypothetical protein